MKFLITWINFMGTFFLGGGWLGSNAFIINIWNVRILWCSLQTIRRGELNNILNLVNQANHWVGWKEVFNMDINSQGLVWTLYKFNWFCSFLLSISLSHIFTFFSKTIWPTLTKLCINLIFQWGHTPLWGEMIYSRVTFDIIPEF